MGGTTGGPKDLPAASAADHASTSPASGLPDGFGGGTDSLTPDPTAPQPSYLTGSIGPGRDNLAEDVWLGSSIMAENGLLPAPTTVATPEFLNAIPILQGAVGATGDGWAGQGGETELAVVNAVNKGEVNLPSSAALPVSSPSLTQTAAEVSQPGRALSDQVSTARKVRDGTDIPSGGALPAIPSPAVGASGPGRRSLLPGPALNDPRDMVKRALIPKLPDPAAPAFDPVEAAGAFRQVATAAESTFPRDTNGNADIQGVKIDGIKADLLEHALKARDRIDMERFESALDHQGNRLSGPETDFLRGLAENRFEDISDEEFEGLTMDGLTLMAKSPTTNAAAAPKPVDRPIDPTDGADGLHHGELAIRKAGRGILDDLRAAQERTAPLSSDETRQLDERIKTTFPHDTEMRQRMTALVRMETAASKLGADIPANAVNRRDAVDHMAKMVNDPARLRAQRDIRSFYDRYPDAEREKLYVDRGEIRLRLENHAANALGISAQMEEQRNTIKTQSAMASAGMPLAKHLVSDATARLARLEEALSTQVEKIADAGSKLAALPTHPHPDIDTVGAANQNATELRARTRKEMTTDAALTAATLGGAMAFRAGKKGAAALLGRTVTASQAASNFARGFNREIAKAVQAAGIDMADRAAVARWAKTHPDIAGRATAKALGDAATGVLSDQAAKHLNAALGDKLGVLGEEAVSRIAEKGIKAIRKQGDPVN
jgi:hypothetical protein